MTIGDRAANVMRALYSAGPAPRFGTQYLLDVLAWIVAIVVAVVLRFEFSVERVVWTPLAITCGAAVAVQFGAGWIFHLYRGRHPYGSFAEVRALLTTILTVGVLVGGPVVLFGSTWGIPRSAVVLALPIAFVLMGMFRYVKRVLVERSIRPADGAENTLVLGAGYIGSNLVRRMLTDPASKYRPRGLIDDDPAKRKVWLHGVRVLGTLDDLEEIALATDSTVLVVAIAKADAALLRRISDAASFAGLNVKVLPPLDEILAGKLRVKDLRDISIEDVIGRHPVDIDVEPIAGYLTGRRVLVTGAGGSIGSELCRQIAKFDPSELIMLDHDETNLQTTQISVTGHGLLDSPSLVLVSIRDEKALAAIFAERLPDVVFHAAALKHLPLLEQHSDEAWKTNVLGTLNVLRAAMNAGVGTFVNVSTDKAANPVSVLGHSKRVGERLTAWAAQQTGRRYLSVRFGNVIGTRGSMFPTFQSLIRSGGPVTITHPDVTRFFMTVPEATQLLVQAGGIGRPGEVLILDMGDPIRIVDVAQRMIDMSGEDIAIVYTGLRPGEKLHEELFGADEADERPIHPQISHTVIAPIAPESLDKAEWERRWRDSAPQTRHAVSAAARDPMDAVS